MRFGTSETEGHDREPVLLRCAACGVLWLTPHGQELVELGEPCIRCGGLLAVEQAVDDNVGVVRKLWDAWFDRDPDKFIGHCHPEAEMRSATSPVVGGHSAVYKGHTGLQHWFEDASALWEAFPQEVQAFGDRILILGRLVRKGPAGEDPAHAVGWVFQIRQGKMLWCRGYLDPEEAVASLQA